MEIISVNIQKGGCGKTTSVQCLSEILNSKYNMRILCIDTDAQCNLTTVSGVSPEQCKHNVYTLLRGESKIQDCIIKTKYYDLVPGSVLLASADNDFNKIGKEQFLKEKLKNVEYDIIFIDTPPALSLLNIMSLTASTKVLIPTECSYLSMIGLNQLYETIETVRKYLNSNLTILGLVMIKYNGRTNINHAIVEALNETVQVMGTKIYDTKIRETVKIKEAQSQLTPVLDWDSKCTAILDYEALAAEIYSDINK